MKQEIKLTTLKKYFLLFTRNRRHDTITPVDQQLIFMSMIEPIHYVCIYIYRYA